jgi:hypothetical protein
MGELDKATSAAILHKADITIQGKEIATTLAKLQKELQLDASL